MEYYFDNAATTQTRAEVFEAMKDYEKILVNRKKATASTQKWRNKQKKKALEPTYQIEPEPTELESEQELPVTASA